MKPPCKTQPEEPAPPHCSPASCQPGATDLHVFWQTSPDLWCIFDTDHRLQMVNPSWPKVLGYAPETLIGRPFFDFVHSEEQSVTAQKLANLQQTGQMEALEIRLQHADGSLRWIEWQGSFHGGLYYGIGRDISPAKVIEEALRDSEMRFRLLAEELPLVAVQGYDLDSTIFFWNKASERLYGFTRKEALGRRLVDLVMPMEQHEDFLLSLRQLALKPRTCAPLEMELLHKAGHAVPILTSHLVASQAGAGPQFFCLDLDLTAIKIAEAAKNRAQRNYELLYQNMFQGFVVCQVVQGGEPRQPDFELISINPAGERLLGIRGSESQGIRLRVLLPPADYACLAHFQRVLEFGETVFFEQYSLKLGKWFEVSVFPLDPGKCGVVFFDITERHQNLNNQKTMLQELHRQKEAAIESSKAKDEFLAVISHELRTPLNAIIGLSSLLLEDEWPDESRYYLQCVSDAGHHQLLLIQQIIEYAQLDQGSLRHSPSCFTLLPFCQSCLEEIKPRAVHLTVNLRNGASGMRPVPEGLQVTTDATILGRILKHLLDNACKYTRQGSVTLEMGMLETGQDLGEFLFAIEDTGMGIAPKIRRQLFRPFSQGDSSYTRAHGGLGLGLATCRKSVKLLEGDIGVESTPDQGSRFWFRLALPCVFESPHRVEETPTTPPTLLPLRLTRPWRILVVDHRTENLAVAQALIQKIGGDSTAATNVHMARALSANVRFDLVLVNLALPHSHSDSPSFARSLRQEEGPNQQTPVVALTSNQDHRLHEEVLSEGVDQILIQPIQIEKLHATLEKLAQEERKTRPGK